MSRARADETQNIVLARAVARSEAEVVADMRRMIRGALESRASMLARGSEGLEYDLGLLRDRVARDGVDADLGEIRVGRFWAVFTEFKLLQRIDRAFRSRADGLEVQDSLRPEEEDP